MNPLSFITRPVRDLTQAVVMPLRALFVVSLCGFINWMTFSGEWWVKWVAFGMAIAVLVAWARAARTLFWLLVVAFVGRAIYRRWGPQMRSAFDDWVARAKPQTAQVLQLLRTPADTAPRFDAGRSA